MIELLETDLKDNHRHSSKGNQLKWFTAGRWYKADYTGYEGLAEYVVSHLLQYSTLQSNEFVLYDTEQIKYKNQMFLGCSSKNFLAENEQLITLERLFKNAYGEGLYKSLWMITYRTAN